MFVALPAIGHVYSTVEIAKRVVERDDRLSATVLVMSFDHDASDSNDYLDKLAAAATADSPGVQILRIRKDDSFAELMRGASPKDFFSLFIEYYKTRVRDAVAKLVESDNSPGLSAMVVDMTLTSMADIATDFGIPFYLYFTSGAAFLGLLLYAQETHDRGLLNAHDFKDPDAEMVVPSYANPVPARVLPKVVTDGGSRSFLENYIRRFREAKGIIVNTFEELEPYAMKSFQRQQEEGKGKGKGSTSATVVYPVGPLLNLHGEGEPRSGTAATDEMIMTWLDGQPPRSVVFLCFGSIGSFGAEQAREIASALERSGYRFLWSLRREADKGGWFWQPTTDFDNVGEVLPEGFLDRTGEVGRVIGWAPQVAVLAHPAIGGFVTHCGWNSTLESIWYGVPMATWPLYAEQPMNAFQMVRELGLAVELKLDYRKEDSAPEGAIAIGEETIERAIRCLMELDGGARSSVEEMKVVSRKVMAGGGSSHASLGRFIAHVIDGAAAQESDHP